MFDSTIQIDKKEIIIALTDYRELFFSYPFGPFKSTISKPFRVNLYTQMYSTIQAHYTIQTCYNVFIHPYSHISYTYIHQQLEHDNVGTTYQEAIRCRMQYIEPDSFSKTLTLDRFLLKLIQCVFKGKLNMCFVITTIIGRSETACIYKYIYMSNIDTISEMYCKR